MTVPSVCMHMLSVCMHIFAVCMHMLGECMHVCSCVCILGQDLSDTEELFVWQETLTGSKSNLVVTLFSLSSYKYHSYPSTLIFSILV